MEYAVIACLLCQATKAKKQKNKNQSHIQKSQIEFIIFWNTAKTLLNKKFRSTLQTMINTVYITISTGFAIFSMFFGSGNLVFPLALGKTVGTTYGYGFAGLVLTAIATPLLGFFALLRCNGKSCTFFRPLGQKLGAAVPLIIILIIGPFGGIPRCITVAHGSTLLTGDFQIPLVYFSLVSAGIIYLASFDETKVLPILGTILTPFLLLSLSLIIYYGVVDAPAHSHSMKKLDAFWTGLHIGYQTMDLLAAIFFAPAIIAYMSSKLKAQDYKPKFRKWMISCAFCIGGGLLSLVYGSFIYLGGSYAETLERIPMESGLATIALHTLGAHAGIVVSLAITMACLTTAIILVSVCASYLQQNVLDKKISLHNLNCGILSTAVVVSIFSFEGIVWALSPVLEVFYPFLILLAFYAIFRKTKH